RVGLPGKQPRLQLAEVEEVVLAQRQGQGDRSPVGPSAAQEAHCLPDDVVGTPPAAPGPADDGHEPLREVAAWEGRRNDDQIAVKWQFTTADARIKLRRPDRSVHEWR